MRKTSLKLLFAATPFLLLLVAGCGAMSSPVAASPGGLLISAEKSTLDTTSTSQLTARST